MGASIRKISTGRGSKVSLTMYTGHIKYDHREALRFHACGVKKSPTVRRYETIADTPNIRKGTENREDFSLMRQILAVHEAGKIATSTFTAPTNPRMTTKIIHSLWLGRSDPRSIV
jgi:hypothetical protein